MKLIIGLGNPGDKYTGTRHNLGFHVLESFVGKHELSFQTKEKFKARVAQYGAGDDKLILALPMTYYNLSGEAVRGLSDYYNVDPTDILVIHDELALPLGTVRTRQGGSDAGNNGVKSITEHLGPDTARLRIGIQTPDRVVRDDADYVLGTFSSDESVKLPGITEKAIDVINSFIAGNFEATTHSASVE